MSMQNPGVGSKGYLCLLMCRATPQTLFSLFHTHHYAPLAAASLAARLRGAKAAFRWRRYISYVAVMPAWVVDSVGKGSRGGGWWRDDVLAQKQPNKLLALFASTPTFALRVMVPLSRLLFENTMRPVARTVTLGPSCSRNIRNCVTKSW